MTTPLADIQARFHDYVVNDGPTPVAAVRPSPRTSAETLLGVYRNNYRQGLSEALAEDFEALQALLGDDAFREMALDYIAVTPSRHYSIRWFGAGLAAFLAGTAPWQARAELAELAAWEWALGEAADAADEAPVDAAAFVHIAPDAWGGLRFRFHPSLRRLDLSWSVPGWRLAVEAAGSEAPAPENLPDLAAGGAPVPWAAWREEVTVLYRSLADGEATVLDKAIAGATFGTLCAALEAAIGEAAAETAAVFLRSWVDHGWIVAVEQ